MVSADELPHAFRPRLPAQRRIQREPVAACGVLAYPLVAIALGRGIAAAEVFGMAPDPTVLATLGILVLAAPAARWALLPIPLAWCAMTGATLWTLGSPEWWLLPAAAVLSIAAAIRQRHGA